MRVTGAHCCQEHGMQLEFDGRYMVRCYGVVEWFTRKTPIQ
jgi:hypothetical protein